MSERRMSTAGNTAALRFMCEMCCYLSFICIIPKLGKDALLAGIFAGLAFVAAFIGVRVRFPALRLLLSLIPGAGTGLVAAFAYKGSAVESIFIMGQIVAQDAIESGTGDTNFTGMLIALGVAQVFLIIVLTAGRFRMEHWQFRIPFGVMLVFCGLFTLVAVIENPIQVWSVVFALSAAFLGIIALREMRMEDNVNGQWRVTNAVIILLPVPVAVGVGALLWLAFTNSGSFFEVLFYPFVLLIQGIMFIMGMFFGLMSVKDDSIGATETPPLMESPPPGGSVPAAEPEPEGPAWLYTSEPVLKYILLGLIAAGVLTAVIIILVKYLKRRNENVEAGFFEDGRHFNMISRSGKKREKNPSNAAKVRGIYKQYLRFVSYRGVPVAASTTSEEVLEGNISEFSADGMNRAANRLRELYLKARYDSPEAVTGADAEEAEACFREIEELIRKKPEQSQQT